MLAVRKLGTPGNPEFGVGAIAEDGTALVKTDTARRAGMTQELLDATLEREIRELRRRVARCESRLHRAIGVIYRPRQHAGTTGSQPDSPSSTTRSST